MDLDLVEKIVHEVKSQGVFDEFRKDLIADVDTKPAYQNLRLRVDSTVKQFLTTTKWTPETNKNQLREKMRRYIADSGFLEMGVERIVHQVVNPKMNSVFQTRIEEIGYKFLGIPVPPKHAPPTHPPLIPALPPLPAIPGTVLEVETMNLLPTDLEQVSPDSTASNKSEVKGEQLDDDEESPPFEPLNMPDYIDNELTTEQNMDLSNTPSPPPEPIEVIKLPLPPPTNTPPPPPGVNEIIDPALISPTVPPLPIVQNGIPPLPPYDDNESQSLPPGVDSYPPLPPVEDKLPQRIDALPPLPPSSPPSVRPPTPPLPPMLNSPTENNQNLSSTDSEQIEVTVSQEKKNTVEHANSLSENSSVKCETKTIDIMATINSNDSQLSQVSSDSHLSTDYNEMKSHSPSEAAVNISEEAQMPKFSENSSESNINNINELHFDINKVDIKFEGTERKASLNENEVDYSQTQEETNKNQKNEESTIMMDILPPQTQTQTIDSNFYSSLNDSSSAQLCIVEPDDRSLSSEASRTVNSIPLVPQATSSPSPPPKAKSTIKSVALQDSLTKTQKHSKSDKNRKEKQKARDRGSSTNKSHRNTTHAAHRKHYDEKNKKENEGSADSKIHKSRSSSSCKSLSRNSSTSHKSSRRSHSSSHKSDKSSTQSTDSSSKKKTVPKENTKVKDDHHYAKLRHGRRKTPDSNDDEEGSGGNSQTKRNKESFSNAEKKANGHAKESKKNSPNKIENEQTETSNKKNTFNETKKSDQELVENLTENETKKSNQELSENLSNSCCTLVGDNMTENKMSDKNEIAYKSDDNCSIATESILENANILQEKIKENTTCYGEDEELAYFNENEDEFFKTRVETLDMFISCCHDAIAQLRNKAQENNGKERDNIEPNNNEPTVNCNDRKRILTYSVSVEENSNLLDCSWEATNKGEERENTNCPEIKRQKIEGDFALSLSTIREINENVQENTITVNNGECLRRTKQNTKQRYTCEDLYKPRSSRTSRRRLSPIL